MSIWLDHAVSALVEDVPAPLWLQHYVKRPLNMLIGNMRKRLILSDQATRLDNKTIIDVKAALVTCCFFLQT